MSKFTMDFKKASDLKISAKTPIYEKQSAHEVDPITYQVVFHKLWQIADEQEKTIQKISGSPIATDAHDFNVMISDSYGEIVVLGTGVVMLGSVMDSVVKWILENRSENPGIEDGDIFLCNDPWVGALHQNDMAMIAPIFVDGKLFAWTGSTIHQVDVGGVNPGSFCIDANDLYAEGQPWPPIKIVKKGEIQSDIEDLWMRQTRAPALLAIDLRAHIASINIVKSRLLKLVERYGADTVKSVMEKSLDYAELRLRNRLKELPDGTFRHVDFHDVAQKGDRGVYKIALTMTKDNDRLIFDFSETDPQIGVINATLISGTAGAVLQAVLQLLCNDIPWSVGGIKRVFTVEAKPGTILSAQHPAGVSMGATGSAWLAGNCANITISKLLMGHPEHKERLVAGTAGSWVTVIPMGLDQYGNPFLTMIMDAMAGGFGARSFGDGVDTGGLLCTPSGQCPNVESNELFFPILYLYRREKTDSGGPGKYRGGLGAELCWIPHDTEQMLLTVSSFGAAIPNSAGISGGYPSNTVQVKMMRDTNIHQLLSQSLIPQDFAEMEGKLEIWQPKTDAVQQKNDVFYFCFQGGGGYGDPLDREPDKVREDVLENRVSQQVAYDVYGVLLDGNGKLDEPATEERRQQIRQARLA
ncbi:MULTISPECIES: hydantoinase B/oxoprolinase family protein [Paenibacillus]|uniref:Hydantoinase B/oxoprolinase family protein n=1 Tax=Paenibacillus validus TaxID=44253 RepID=A0A7X2ZDS0_9BACL|nr:MULTISPECIES: hydantoinase B/oxoprolinase family protein [Paenibacillus]MUG72383.1 hydantoinase B/oxoprolinase family protein [Paenibacillus validus]